jgi:hypothetical protein
MCTISIPPYPKDEMVEVLVKRGLPEAKTKLLIDVFLDKLEYAIKNNKEPIPTFRDVINLSEEINTGAEKAAARASVVHSPKKGALNPPPPEVHPVAVDNLVLQLQALINTYYDDVKGRTSINNPLNIVVKELSEILGKEDTPMNKIEKFYSVLFDKTALNNQEIQKSNPLISDCKMSVLELIKKDEGRSWCEFLSRACVITLSVITLVPAIALIICTAANINVFGATQASKKSTAFLEGLVNILDTQERIGQLPTIKEELESMKGEESAPTERPIGPKM